VLDERMGTVTDGNGMNPRPIGLTAELAQNLEAGLRFTSQITSDGCCTLTRSTMRSWETSATE